jgi:hypothetical protein
LAQLAVDRYRVVNQLELSAAAYIAGLVDGEGTITLTSTHRNERRRIVVSISNTDRALLDYVRDAVGAGHVTGKRTYSERHTPSFCYSIRSRQPLDLLSPIAGLLRTYRRKRADIALTRYIANTPRNGKYSAPLEGQRTQFEREFLAIGPGPRRKAPK